jgi:ATP-dependent 26S proteasome regulatory subunit
MGKAERKPLSSADVLSSLRDLIVHLHRSNAAQAESIVTEVVAHLKQVMTSGADPKSPEMLRAQQTMFAVDEVRTLLAQQDFTGAAVAARDAAKEWKQPS